MGIFLILYMVIGFLMCKDTLGSKPENLLNMNEENLQYWLKEKSNKGISKERKFEIEKNIKYMERRNKDLKFEIANKNMNWNERLKKQNNDLRERLKEVKLKGNTTEISEYKDQIATNEYYLNNNIRPTPNYEITAFSLLPKINMFVGLLIISVIIGIIVSDSVSGEFNPATIKFLLTKPVSRSRILFSKFMASILICAFSFKI
ncbi:ABC transporter permease subunit [Clostridium sp. Marseille-Q2269]|uniref:ABC transporter permease subunit n=1 Tax=Clostridium sp. Marseille-Q2269 TaxID=2942205 RepID=UPI00336537FD